MCEDKNGHTSGNSDLPVAYPTFSRHQLRRGGSSKRSGPLGDQPFAGVLQLENLTREGLVDVLRAAVVDQRGEGWGWEGQLHRDLGGQPAAQSLLRADWAP